MSAHKSKVYDWIPNHMKTLGKGVSSFNPSSSQFPPRTAV
jgi:hypothetical protein